MGVGSAGPCFGDSRGSLDFKPQASQREEVSPQALRQMCNDSKFPEKAVNIILSHLSGLAWKGSWVLGWGFYYNNVSRLLLLTGPPVNVALALEVASIDHISEANMVGASQHSSLGCVPSGGEQVLVLTLCLYRNTP